MQIVLISNFEAYKRSNEELEIGDIKLFPARGSCRAFTSDDDNNHFPNRET